MAQALLRGGLIPLAVGWGLAALAAAAHAESFVVPGSKAADLEQCVEPTEYMRRNHMELIKHQRDETVHEGIRSATHSLAACIQCHVSYQDSQPVAVNTRDQFCGKCHAFTAVVVNCFDCHATIPTEPRPASARYSQGHAFAGHSLSELDAAAKLGVHRRSFSVPEFLHTAKREEGN